MNEPTAVETNRLGEEASPYLREHADNPVHWQPWDETALAAARGADVPIFLSVGYAACHWCHVMEEESFQDDTVAELLNEAFVPIKVDREERPDLDRIYQTVCHKVSGGGGWPLSVWLTPDGDPFYVGTYFPRRAKGDRPGFLEVCRNVADSWADPEQREEMRRRGEQWAATARQELESTDAPGAGRATGGAGPDSGPAADADAADPDGLVDGSLDDAVTTALRSADREYGGFGRGGPKFPQPGRVDLLLRAADRADDPEPLRVARETLDAMGDGGLFDHVGGGFHRYCTDREWVVPHFEKMLYDNASLARLYLDAHRLTDESRYAVVGRETLAFLDRELSHPEGGFYASLDADAGGREGAFYVWDESSLTAALTEELGGAVLDEIGVGHETAVAVVRDRFGVDEPNFEGGTTVLTVAASVDDLAADHDLDPATVTTLLGEARAALYDARETRERPPRDEKVIAAWNGLAVSAFAAGARTLDAGLAARGADALGFVREHLWDGDRLARRYVDPADVTPVGHDADDVDATDGADGADGADNVDDERGPGTQATDDPAATVGGAAGTGYLADYAFLARGALELYGVTGDVDHLAFALELAEVILEAFYDETEGTIYATPADGEELIARPQEPTDRSTPSSLGVAVSVLLDLDDFRPDAGFADAAADALATHRDRIAGRPLEHVSLALAAAKHARGPLELTLAADDPPTEWRDTLAREFLADAVLAPRPATEADLADWLTRLDTDEAPPVWANRTAREGEPTAYVCRGRTCSPPRASLYDALTWTPGE